MQINFSMVYNLRDIQSPTAAHSEVDFILISTHGPGELEGRRQEHAVLKTS